MCAGASACVQLLTLGSVYTCCLNWSGYICKNDGGVDILIFAGGAVASWEHTHPEGGRIRGRSFRGTVYPANLKETPLTPCGQPEGSEPNQAVKKHRPSSRAAVSVARDLSDNRTQDRDRGVHPSPQGLRAREGVWPPAGEASGRAGGPFRDSHTAWCHLWTAELWMLLFSYFIFQYFGYFL